MLSKMSSQTGASANYNVRLPTDTQIIKGDYYSVSKLLEEMKRAFKRNLLEMEIQVIGDIALETTKTRAKRSWGVKAKGRLRRREKGVQREEDTKGMNVFQVLLCARRHHTHFTGENMVSVPAGCHHCHGPAGKAETPQSSLRSPVVMYLVAP